MYKFFKILLPFILFLNVSFAQEVDSVNLFNKEVDVRVKQIQKIIFQNDKQNANEKQYVFSLAGINDINPPAYNSALSGTAEYNQIKSDYPAYHNSTQAEQILHNYPEIDIAKLEIKLNAINTQLNSTVASKPIIFIGLDAFMGRVELLRQLKTSANTFNDNDVEKKADFIKAFNHYDKIDEAVLTKVGALTGRRIIVIRYGGLQYVEPTVGSGDEISSVGKKAFWRNYFDTQENSELRKLIFFNFNTSKVDQVSVEAFIDRIFNVLIDNFTIINCDEFVGATSLKKLRTEADANKIAKILAQFNPECYRLLEKEDRAHALEKLAYLSLQGSLFGNGLEHICVKLISTTPNDVTHLEFIKTALVTKIVDGNILIFTLMKKIDDAVAFGIGGNNYKELIKALNKNLLKTPSFLGGFSGATEKDYIGDNSFVWDKSYSISLFNEPIGTQKFEVSMESDGRIKVIRQYVSGYTITGATRGGLPKYGPQWVTENAVFFAPFAPIIFIDKSNLGLIEGSSEEGTGLGNVAVVPAIYFQYASDKKFEADVIEGINLAVDIASVATGGGAVLSALKTASRVARVMKTAYVVADVANAGCNIAIALGDFPAGGGFESLVNDYNAIMGTIGLTKLGAAGVGRVPVSTAYGAVANTTTLGKVAKDKSINFIFKVFSKKTFLANSPTAQSKSISLLANFFMDELALLHKIDPEDIYKSFKTLNDKGITNISDEMVEVMAAAFSNGKSGALNNFFSNSELTLELFDEIQARLKKYNGANELLDIVKANPDELKSIKEILENPDHFKEIVAMNNIASSSFLYKWAKGSFYRYTRDYLFKLGDELETFVTNNIVSKAPFNSLLTPPTNYLKARQVRLKPFGSTTASFWISDDLVFVNVGTMPNGKPIFEAYLNDTKLTTNAPWTKNQTEYLMKPFRDGESQLEFEVLSDQITILPKNSKVIIKKQNVFKSTSCGDNRISNCFETNLVTNFAANLYRN